MELGIINNNNNQFNLGVHHHAAAAPDQVQAHKVAPVTQPDAHNKTQTENEGSGNGQAAMGEQQRREAVERGSEAVSKSFQPKTVRFTIFKGPDGNYITRFTDLSDGSVRYIPEPEIMDYMRKMDAIQDSLLDTRA